MRKSRSITLTVLAGLMLTGCLISNFGCGGRRSPPPVDHSWYDANGNRVEQKWKTDAQGQQVKDAQGRPIPDPHVPYDNYGRPWVYTGGVWAPLPPPVSYSRSSSSTWLSGGSGYRTTSGSSYRPSPSIGSSSSTSSPSRSSSSSPSSISRGGFGSTGAGSSSS
jgi:hypothetical protein